MNTKIDYGALPVFDEADIVVCGGGTAGAYAARAAADMGADVLIVEQSGALGGSQTNGLVTPVMYTHIKGNPQCSYVSRIVRDKLSPHGGCRDDGMNFDPLLMEMILEDVCEESGVRFLYHTFISDALVSDGKITSLVVANKSGLGLIRGRVFVDCTGDADVCVFAGAETMKGDPEHSGMNQAVSLRYVVSGVDFDAFGEQIKEEVERTGTDKVAKYYDGKLYLAVAREGNWTFSELFDRAISAGDLIENDKFYWQGFTSPAGRVRSLSTIRSFSTVPTGPIRGILPGYSSTESARYSDRSAFTGNISGGLKTPTFRTSPRSSG